MLFDTYPLKDLLRRIFKNPKLVIEGAAKASGQRVVYFCHFEDVDGDVEFESLKDASSWNGVVLKVSEGDNPQHVAYLEKEIEILNGFDSPCYPKLLYNSVFSHDPDTEILLPHRLFVTIEERIEAVPLSACMDRFRDEASALALLRKIVDALKLMWTHSDKLVHRDLKPDNILVKANGDIVIIDLAILREEGAIGVTNSFVPWGPCSLPYASPEQVTNDKKNISFKTDIFLIGVLMHELLSGSCPFLLSGADSRDEVMARICNLDVPPLEVSVVGPVFSRLIQRMLSKQPYQRFRKIEDFEAAVEQVIESQKS